MPRRDLGVTPFLSNRGICVSKFPCCAAAVVISLLLLPSTWAAETLTSRLKAVSSALLNAEQINGKHQIEFREERYSELLIQPVTFEGKLIYDPESRSIKKAVTHPNVVSMTMNDQALVLETSEGKRRLSLRTRPALRAIMAGFRALVEGDVDALESHFESNYQQQAGEWRLVLTPRANRLSKRMKSLTIIGQGSRVDSIVTRMKNGDHQIMTLIPMLAERK